MSEFPFQIGDKITNSRQVATVLAVDGAEGWCRDEDGEAWTMYAYEVGGWRLWVAPHERKTWTITTERRVPGPVEPIVAHWPYPDSPWKVIYRPGATDDVADVVVSVVQGGAE